MRKYIDSRRAGWNDEDEKNFLQHLGSFQDPDAIDILPRRAKLEGYLAAIHKRENWGNMNKHSILAFCEYMISEENRLAAEEIK